MMERKKPDGFRASLGSSCQGETFYISEIIFTKKCELIAPVSPSPLVGT